LTCIKPAALARSPNSQFQVPGRLDPDQGDRARIGQHAGWQWQQQEHIMPAGEVLFITAFIVAFGVFAIVLGWADRRTRHLNR